jgi:AraC family transcriptional regulator
MNRQPAEAVNLEKILCGIEEVPITDQSVSSVADKCGWSIWHTQRIFHALTGQSLGHYIRARKLTEAAKLLRDSKLSVLEVALEIGFGSHEAFSRSFLAYFGESPKNFRKRRPQVSPLLKPVLTQSYVEHLDSISLEPEIKMISQFSVAGISRKVPSPFEQDKPTYDCLLPFWKQFLEMIADVPRDLLGHNLIGIIESESGTYEESHLNYLAACEVSPSNEIDNRFTTVVFPSQTYAVFANTGGGNSTVHLVDYIYGTWLPRSKFERSSGHDFEVFDRSFKFDDANSTSFYYVPIKNR